MDHTPEDNDPLSPNKVRITLMANERSGHPCFGGNRPRIDSRKIPNEKPVMSDFSPGIRRLDWVSFGNQLHCLMTTFIRR